MGASIQADQRDVGEGREILGVLGQLLELEEARHKQRVTEIKKVVGAVERIVSEPQNGPIDLAMALSLARRRRPEYAPIEIVSKVVKDFGNQIFTIGDLCERIPVRFPEATLDRSVVSRRLYELRRGLRPIVEVVASEFLPGLKGKQRLYRYIGPP